MPNDIFQRRKKDTLSRLDKSSKKSWDKKIKSLCEKINSLEDYYTTSSCSGRVVLMLDSEKKTEGLFIKVYHDLISFKQLKKDLANIIILHSQARDINKKYLNKKNSGLIVSNKILFSKNKLKESSLTNLNIKFKQEPCIIHIACRELNDAVKILEKTKLTGWKRSGIIATGKRFVVEAVSTEKLEFPIIDKGRILIDDNFLRKIVSESNKNLNKSWMKIGKFEKLL